MRIVYIAGPYAGKTIEERDKNIKVAEKAAIKVWEMGFAAFCPHLNTKHFEDKTDLPDSQFYLGDIEILKKCDYIVMLPGWRESKGSFAEYSVASALGLLVFENITELENHSRALKMAQIA